MTVGKPLLARLRTQADTLVQRVDALSLRERLMVMAAVLFVLGALWEALLAAPLSAREQRATQQLNSLKQRIAALDETMAATAEGMDSNVPDKLKRLQQLRGRLDEANESFRIFLSDLVDPGQMRLVLEDLVARQGALRITGIRSLEPEQLFPDEEEEPSAAQREMPKLFRHGLALEMEGGYLECLSYLQALEILPWRIYWAKLDVETEDYPSNRILVELHTLSLDEEWMGV